VNQFSKLPHMLYCRSLARMRECWTLSNAFDMSKYTAISIKVVPEQSGKVEYERERLAGNR
jgi:hypothetical protein